MMPSVGTFLPMSRKLCSFLNKANKNVSESPSKPGLISAKKDIFLICYRTDVPESKSVFSPFTKILREIPTEDIPSRLSKRPSHLPKIAHTKLSLT
jgi:hypothetical protein